jgi:hypothetical protein
MKRILVAALIAGAFSGCSTPDPLKVSIENYTGCTGRVNALSQFSPLRDKGLIGKVEEIPTALMANGSYPTQTEKDLLAEWSDKRSRCFITHTTSLKETMQPEQFQVAKMAMDRQKLLYSNFYAGKLSYAQYSRERLYESQQVESAFEQLRQLYAERQNQENEKKRQVLLMQLQSQLNKPAPAPMPAPYMVPMPAPAASTTSCTTIGNQVNCVSR